jgi:hypothetical protein
LEVDIRILCFYVRSSKLEVVNIDKKKKDMCQLIIHGKCMWKLGNSMIVMCIASLFRSYRQHYYSVVVARVELI